MLCSRLRYSWSRRAVKDTVTRDCSRLNRPNRSRNSLSPIKTRAVLEVHFQSRKFMFWTPLASDIAWACFKNYCRWARNHLELFVRQSYFVSQFVGEWTWWAMLRFWYISGGNCRNVLMIKIESKEMNASVGLDSLPPIPSKAFATMIPPSFIKVLIRFRWYPETVFDQTYFTFTGKRHLEIHRVYLQYEPYCIVFEATSRDVDF